MPKLSWKLLIVCTSVLGLSFIIAPGVHAEEFNPTSAPDAVPAVASAQQAQFSAPLGADAVEGVGCGGENFDAFDAAFEQDIVDLVNQERAARGLPPLKHSEDLSLATRYHARDMSEDEYFDHNTHDRINGELTLRCAWSQRIRSYVPDAGTIGENIVVGYQDAEDAMNAWMNSEGHRNNILGDYRELGIGFYASYSVQNFAERTNFDPLVINLEAAATDSTTVDLYAYGEWEEYRMRIDGGAWSAWSAFSSQLTAEIPAVNGLHRIDMEMRSGDYLVASSDTIVYAGTSNTEPSDEIEIGEHGMFLPLVRR